jgi:hypothetical protein
MNYFFIFSIGDSSLHSYKTMKIIHRINENNELDLSYYFISLSMIRGEAGGTKSDK